MSAATIQTPVYDRTARKAHQWTMVALVAAGLILQGIAGALLLTVAAVIMLAGRFWWPADVVRQLVWRVLEPAGILKRDDVHEDHETRRIARVLGGIIWLLAAGSMLAGNPVLAWVLTLPIAVMVALDASLDFCALCFVVAQLNRRGILRRA
jgi:hypothetical protein